MKSLGLVTEIFCCFCLLFSVVVAPACYAQSASSDDPADIVRIMYNTSGADQAPYQLWSPRMKKLWARQDEAGGYGGGALDFNPIYASQDPDMSNLKIDVLHRLDSDAEVRVSFGSGSLAQELRYDLVQTNGSWLVNDIRCVSGDDHWVLSDILKLNR